jgi:Helix-turn-helix domain
MPKKTSDDFPSRMRSERARLGLTQDGAAELIDCGRGTYRQFEQYPARDVRLSTLVRLVRAGYRLQVLAPELTAQ